MRRLASRNESLLFAAATAVVAAHAAVDSFIAPEPGTGPGAHLARGLVTLALLGLAIAAYPRLRAGARAAVAAALGALALEGAVLAVRDAHTAGARGEDWTGFLLGPVGGMLLALAVALVWRSRKPGRLRWLRRAGLAALTVVATYLLVVPVAMAILATHRPRAVVQPAQLGRQYEEVTLRTSDGLRLAGWYVPSRNGAAVISTRPVKASCRRRGCSSATATASCSSTHAATTAARATRTNRTSGAAGSAGSVSPSAAR